MYVCVLRTQTLPRNWNLRSQLLIRKKTKKPKLNFITKHKMIIINNDVLLSSFEWASLHKKYPGNHSITVYDEDHAAIVYDGKKIILDKNLEEYKPITVVKLGAQHYGKGATFLVKIAYNDVTNPCLFEFICSRDEIISDLGNLSDTRAQMWLAEDYIHIKGGVLDITKMRLTRTPDGSDYVTIIYLGNGVHNLYEPRHVSYDVEPKDKGVFIEGKLFYLEDNDKDGHLKGATYSKKTESYHKSINMNHVITITTLDDE
jgi:hypothetical protein